MFSLTNGNRKEKSATYVSEFESAFKCPVCDTSMHVEALKSLICDKHHTFDFTKQGYINLMKKQLKTKYGKELFEARRRLIAEDGFFAPLSKAIAGLIKKQIVSGDSQLSLLDTGCGEGSHLVTICDQLNKESRGPVVGAGIDISKEGILIAAKNYSEKIWAVADLANIPFKNQQFDVILNILSPSNYAEFSRLLCDDGLVVKVVPQSGYLKELRAAYFDESEKQSYSNAETVDRFNEKFELIDSTRIQYTNTLNKESIYSLVKMTPLTWAAPEERVAAFLERESAQITVDFEVLVGRKTKKTS